jgi:nicotinamide riboside kinase
VRIAFSGSGGTGKTSLLTELNKELDYPVIGEGIREWLDEHNFDDFKDMALKDVVQMQEDTLKRKMDIESELQSFIADRTTVDNLTYALRWIGSEDKDYDTWMAQYITHAMNHANINYDIIFLLPWGEIPLVDDGTRSTKQWYQYLIQSILERHIYMLERPYVYEVYQTTVEGRVEECLKIINSVDLNVLG